MSRPLQSLHGVELVDALLEEWRDHGLHTQERSTLAWDDFAEGIMARIDSEGGRARQVCDDEVTSDAKFLLAPNLNGANTSGAEAPVSHPLVPVLLTAAEDARAPHLEETMGASQRDRRSSLQDLAKMANEGPRSQRGGNGPDSFAAAPMSQRSTGRLSEGSGVVDLQSLSVLPVYGDAPSEAALPPSSVQANSDTFAVGTAPLTPAAPPGYAAFASEAPPPPSMQESVPPMPLSIAPASLSDSGIVQPRRMSGPGVGVVFGGIVGVLAVAAGALFFVVSKKAPANETAAASTTVVAPAEKTEEVAAVAPVAAVEEAAKPSDGTDPTALPVTGAKGADTDSHRTHGSSKDSAPVAAAATPASKKEAKEAAAKEAKEAKKVAAAEPPPPSGIPDNDLGKAMKVAGGPGVVGSGVENKADAQFAAGTVPQRPSQGTLTSALGRVLGKAKACIGPDDPISRASVVFASAGTVSSVAVSGNAAGKPAEACIKSALSGAKLNTPFAEPTYTTTVTIRP